jgi:hypothetical protein
MVLIATEFGIVWPLWLHRTGFWHFQGASFSAGLYGNTPHLWEYTKYRKKAGTLLCLPL